MDMLMRPPRSAARRHASADAGWFRPRLPASARRSETPDPAPKTSCLPWSPSGAPPGRRDPGDEHPRGRNRPARRRRRRSSSASRSPARPKSIGRASSAGRSLGVSQHSLAHHASAVPLVPAFPIEDVRIGLSGYLPVAGCS
ncbi:hypothetical protein FH610_017220 [Microbispora catharanthi]|uniref:Uncharacterized protein n=1 Tax=Microbispora catharanthi TaxID=1712871 RepID=A0A5N6BUE7_9ACTN|nr:hypothetical protein FH610_017220 [Microbispora catharanthi]